MKRMKIEDILAMILVAGWIFDLLTNGKPNEVYTNIIVLIMGYFYGSSIGSKKKTEIMNKQSGG